MTGAAPPTQQTGAIHPTAQVSSEAEIGRDVSIGAFAIVEGGSAIGDACSLEAHAIVRTGARLGAAVRVDSFVVVGGDPQDKGFDRATRSGVSVGAGTVLREGVTIHRSAKGGGLTAIGERVLMMAHAHAGHDCHVDDDVVIANNAMLGGHVKVGLRSFIGGGVGVHQFVRIGEHAMVGGNAAITVDIPPFTTVAGRNALFGLNRRGLRRCAFSNETLLDLAECYRRVLRNGAEPVAQAAHELEAGECGRTDAGRRFLEFFGDGGPRGFARCRTRAGNRRSTGGAGGTGNP